MLTADLVEARIVRGKLVPAYVDPADPVALAVAETVSEVFIQGAGATRAVIENEIHRLGGVRKEYLFHRGLAKLLFDRAQLQTELPAGADPAEFRARVFTRAAQEWLAAGPLGVDPELLRAKLADELGVQREELQRLLFADLKEEQVLRAIDPVAPANLLREYNLALCQAVLLRATRLEIQIPPQPAAVYRALFRAIKFHRLLYEVEGDATAGYRISLDGPLSMFSAAAKYGVSFANFVPTLLHCDGFDATATVGWGRARTTRTFEFSHADGFAATTHLAGAYQPEEMGWFSAQFAKLESDWEISEAHEIVDLGGRGVLVADYVFIHRGTGLVVPFEILGYWRRGSLESRLRLLREHGRGDVLLGIGRGLSADEGSLADVPAQIYVFRSVPIAREVRERLDAMARAAPSS
jgi:uncharacterized protein